MASFTGEEVLESAFGSLLDLEAEGETQRTSNPDPNSSMYVDLFEGE